jgi:uncharacterized protein
MKEEIKAIKTTDILDKIKKIIVHTYRPDKILLFGSRSRGDFTCESDIDIVVVSDREKDLPRVKRGLKVRLLLAKFELPIDILFFTHEEMQRWVTIPQSFTATLLREGTIIYEKRTTRVYPKMDPKS